VEFDPVSTEGPDQVRTDWLNAFREPGASAPWSVMAFLRIVIPLDLFV
jgi:hypothetical protein